MTNPTNETVIAKYEAWLNDPLIDAATKEELRGIAGQEKEITDRFYRDLEFGTGGLRGVMGAGTNRLNAYTVGKATQGSCELAACRRSFRRSKPVCGHCS